MSDVPEHRAIIPWIAPKDRPEVKAAHARDEQAIAARTAANASALAKAEAQRVHAETQAAAGRIVLATLKKWAELVEHPDFAATVGPLDPGVVLKLAEFASKQFRLDNGQATENVAHAVAHSLDFSKLTQEQRNKYRELLILAGAGDAPE